MNLSVDYVAGEWSRYKNGRIKYWLPAEVTWLRKCDHCGFTGTPRRVAYRSECYMPEWGDLGMNIDLCTSCWNRFRVLVKGYWLLVECRYLINRLVRLSRASA